MLQKRLTINDKSSWATPRKRPVSLNAWVFQSAIFTFRPSQCQRSVFQHWKGGEVGLVIEKNTFFKKLREDTDRKHLFCSNVSTLLSLIVNHGQKQLRHPPKKTCCKRVSFSICNFHISTPSPLFNVVTTWQCQRSVFQHWKGREGGLAIGKRDVFLKLREDTDRKRWFCSNVSTLLSLIVGYKSSIPSLQKFHIALHKFPFFVTKTSLPRALTLSLCLAT